MTTSATAKTATLQRVPKNTPVADILEIVDADGGVIIEKFLTEDQVRRFNEETQPALDALDAGSKHDDEFVAEFHGNQTKRLTNLVTISKTFREEILEQDLLYDLGEAIFREESGDFWLTTGQIIDIGPGNKAQMLHRDLENNHFAVTMGKSGPMVMVNFLIALTDFTEENGATRIIPGSNTWDDYEDRGTPEMTIPAEMKAGDVIFFNGKVSHGGGANVTKDERRRGLTIPLQPGFLTPEEAYPLIVDLELAKTLSPRVQKLLGFRSQYPKGSPGLWQNNYEEIANHLGL
ncbi:phytanoyl-CoA dioxygenase family protein [soil metagenome]